MITTILIIKQVFEENEAPATPAKQNDVSNKGSSTKEKSKPPDITNENHNDAHHERDDSDVSSEASPVSSRGGVYSNELLETFGLNIHRIDKDVKRCDRNYWYFTESNLEKLRNVMCT